MAKRQSKEQRKERVLKAIKMMEEGKALLEDAGFKLVFDSYNDDGVYAVPEQVDFPDYCHGDDANAGEFLADCPVVIEVDGLYNDGCRGATDVPYWWNGWKKFIGKKD
jgi:hypothetical protein